jgi:hypothetical protein
MAETQSIDCRYAAEILSAARRMRVSAQPWRVVGEDVSQLWTPRTSKLE